MMQLQLSDEALDQIAQRICGAHGNPYHQATFSWENFPYRSGPKIEVFFRRDCGLQNVPEFNVPPASGTRITYAKQVLQAIADGTVRKHGASDDESLLFVIERLLKSVAHDSKLDHAEALNEIVHVLAPDGLSVLYADGRYQFQYAPQTDLPSIRILGSKNEDIAPIPNATALDHLEEYERILSIIQSVSLMFERSPGAYRNSDEEDLRQHILATLNTHYPGQATGETFNNHGKTDILLRRGDSNVFVAECKIWRGPKSLYAALDQLLSYLTWRDTKAAIVIFNRGGRLTHVLEQIPPTLQTHPQFKEMLPFESETGFRSVLYNRGDPKRPITLTVLAFDVPS